MSQSSKTNKRNTVAVIEKALTIISFLEKTKDGIGLTEIAKQTNINKTSCYRILQTLMLDNVVEYGDLEGTYRLGFRLLELGNIVKQRIDVRTIALPYMKELTEKTDDTTYLCILNDNKSLCIERVEGTHVQILLLNVGDVWPLYVGAAPRAMLAFLEEEKVNEILATAKANDEINSHSYVTDIDYKKLVRDTKKKGYSVSFEDVISGVSSIGAPIFNNQGKVIASISISSTSKKISKNKEDEIAQDVVNTANQISHSLGWRGIVGS
jgi:DNA-binding IclR family transcriptional regulator